MSEQAVEFVTFHETRTPVLRPTAFVFREDRPLHWLHVLKPRDFMDRLFGQHETIVGYFNRRPKELLIGAEDYAEMMHDLPPEQAFQFMAEYGHNRSRCGLTVRVIPWMRGVLVMP